MKKTVQRILLGVGILILAGSSYKGYEAYNAFIKEKKENALFQKDVEKVVAEINKNRNTNIPVPIVGTQPKYEDIKDTVVNTKIDQNVPEGFYDRVLGDGYTYNNPKPIDPSLIIPNEDPSIPGTISSKDYYDHETPSWSVPVYPFEIYDGRNSSLFMNTIDYRYIDFNFYHKTKKEFAEWFSKTYEMKFIFVNHFNHEFESKYFTILVLDEPIEKLKVLEKDLKRDKVSCTFGRFTGNEYKGTELIRKFSMLIGDF